jgi:hypothetical protein
MSSSSTRIFFESTPNRVLVAVIVVLFVVTIITLVLASLAFHDEQNKGGTATFSQLQFDNGEVKESLQMLPDATFLVGQFTTQQRVGLSNSAEMAEIVGPVERVATDPNAFGPKDDGTIVFDTDLQALFTVSAQVWKALLMDISSSSLDVTNNQNGTVTCDLPASGVTAGSYTAPTVSINKYGIITSATNNSGIVVSVSGTAGQIDSTGGAMPVISLDPGLLTAIESWQSIAPTATPVPTTNQFLVFGSTRLAWRNVGTQPVSVSVAPTQPATEQIFSPT